MNYNELLKKYNKALKHISKLEEENRSLKFELGHDTNEQPPIEPYMQSSIKETTVVHEAVDDTSSNKEKVELYLSLFRGREDVCAKRWVSNKTGNVGYSPYCLNEWISGLCGKKDRIKCSKCQNKKFIGLDKNTLRKHFKGEETLGLYPVDQEDKCYFIVMDFDKDNWQEEIITVVSVCKESNISYYVERSRSGDGGHIWYFFKEKMTASKARKFALNILDIAMDKDSNISFKAYDRLIPSQDFLIKEGFGNLIALPLQKGPRENANSVFVDEKFIMIEDQWKCLSDIKKISEIDIDKFIALNKKKNISHNELTIEDGANISKSDFPSKLMVILRNGIVIQKKEMSSKGIVFLRKMASYLNPEFYSKQAMRMSTYKTPRMTVVYEENESELILPIGVLMTLLDVMKSKDVNIVLKEERLYGKAIDISFSGELRNEQQIAFDKLTIHDNGVLSATPIRKDGHYRIIFMYCGPIRYKVDPKKQAIERDFEHYLVPRFTSCRKPLYQIEEDWHISDVMKHICESNMRNELIISDVDKVIEEGRNPIILTERSSHIELLKRLMVDKQYDVVELSGRLKTKERRKSLEIIRNRSSKDKMVIIATGKLVGEGFDVPWLDTLFLAMPIAWKGTITQYAGRLHRELEGKNEVRVYDYVDVHISKMAKMYSKRLTAYKGVGYKIKSEGVNKNDRDEIFSGDTYFNEFIADIGQSKKAIIISAPFIQKRKFESIKELLYRKYSEGIRVVVCIKEIEEYNERTKINMHKIYSELENNGINVIQIEGLNYKFAIFDNEIVWYGGVELLAGNRSTDSVIRIISGALSNELYGTLE